MAVLFEICSQCLLLLSSLSSSLTSHLANLLYLPPSKEILFADESCLCLNPYHVKYSQFLNLRLGFPFSVTSPGFSALTIMGFLDVPFLVNGFGLLVALC